MATVAGGQGSRNVPVDRSEGFGERLLGLLLDRAHEMPLQLTDQFFRARRRAPMSVAAEIQWSLLPR